MIEQLRMDVLQRKKNSLLLCCQEAVPALY